MLDEYLFPVTGGGRRLAGDGVLERGTGANLAGNPGLKSKGKKVAFILLSQ